MIYFWNYKRKEMFPMFDLSLGIYIDYWSKTCDIITQWGVPNEEFFPVLFYLIFLIRSLALYNISRCCIVIILSVCPQFQSYNELRFLCLKFLDIVWIDERKETPFWFWLFSHFSYWSFGTSLYLQNMLTIFYVLC